MRSKLYAVGLATVVAVLAPVGAAQAEVIYGTPFNNTIVGTAGDDVIYAGLGNDKVYGLGGNDRIYGGWGDDYIEGGKGNDYIDGDSGKDVLHGSEAGLYGSFDQIYPFIQEYTGVADRDVIYGRLGDDMILGGADTDELYGGWGNDELRAGVPNFAEDNVRSEVVDCGLGFLDSAPYYEGGKSCEIQTL